MTRAILLGTGRYLPERRVKTRDMEAWTFENRGGQSYHILASEVVEKTGITERRVAAPDTATSDLAARAGKEALIAAGVHPDDVDLLLLATSTPDYTIPKCAPLAAAKIGLHGTPAYDFGKDSTGFLEALEAASYYIEARRYRHILVIGAETCSRILNPRNKATSVLYGDGAGAVLLGAGEDENRGFLGAVAGSQGDNHKSLYIPSGGGARPFDGSQGEAEFRLHMDPDAMAAYGRQVIAMGVERVLAEHRLTPDDIGLLVPHQANLRLIESACQSLDIPLAKVVLTAEHHGNTAAASIPTALDVAVREGRLPADTLVAFVAFGGGLSWISALLRT